MQNGATAWLAGRWRQFKRDVWDNPSIGPVAGVLLSALGVLIVWLTLEYAPEAHVRGDLAPSDREGGAIKEEWGWMTVAAMTALTLTVGFERAAARWWQTGGPRLETLKLPALRVPLRGLWLALRVVAKVSSVGWSVVDFALARYAAALVAGAAWPGSGLRYAWFIGVMATAGLLSAFASAGVALVAVCVALLAIVALVRRWSWIEADRNTFLIQRGQGEGALRIGFEEDLQDEALFALACLFLLIPLGLDQLQEITCADYRCAFAFDSARPMPDAGLGRFLAWLAFFGAELFKTVPFVDWSEVFHVANGSPIKPQTALGSQVVFVLRAGLDLLFLAAVLQAVSIAGRLREQDKAFWSNRLPILDPFSEARELTRTGAALEPALELRPTEEPAIKDFPVYQETRLRELIESRATEPLVRKAAVALLAAKHPGEETDRFLFEQARAEANPVDRAWMETVASGLAPERAEEVGADDRERLIAILADRSADLRQRCAAARRLGRMGKGADSVLGGSSPSLTMPVQPDPARVLIDTLDDDRTPVELRADLAVALAKVEAISDAQVSRLASQFRGRLLGEQLAPVMAAAFALARLHRGASPTEIAEMFHSDLRDHAARAAAIRLEPLDIHTAKEPEIGACTEQMVAITPGRNGFPASFLMGAPDPREGDPRDPARRRADQEPQVEIVMERPFAIGRFPVTVREYRGYALAMGRQPPTQPDHTPVVEVSWRDACAYADWLERITGERYRLPTEAESEYACRAGTTTRYWWGDTWDPEKAVSQYSEVNSQGPNPWGLWDLYGHVYEWCADPWHTSHRGRPTSAMAWLSAPDVAERTGSIRHRVVRGGSWSHPVGERLQEIRSSYRNEQIVTHAQTNYGFRLARSLR